MVKAPFPLIFDKEFYLIFAQAVGLDTFLQESARAFANTEVLTYLGNIFLDFTVWIGLRFASVILPSRETLA